MSWTRRRAEKAALDIRGTENEQLTIMHHPNTWRRVLFVIFACAWVFVLLALGSFHTGDWPSHAVYPYQPVENL